MQRVIFPVHSECCKHLNSAVDLRNLQADVYIHCDSVYTLLQNRISASLLQDCILMQAMIQTHCCSRRPWVLRRLVAIPLSRVWSSLGNPTSEEFNTHIEVGDRSCAWFGHGTMQASQVCLLLTD